MSNVANARLKAKELQKKAAKEAEAKSKEEGEEKLIKY